MTDLKKQEHGGVLYHHYVTNKDAAGVFAFNKECIRLTGELRITFTEGSYKFGKEIQFRVLAPHNASDIKTKKRNSSTWDTMEINMPVEEIPNIIKALKTFQEIINRKKDAKA